MRRSAGRFRAGQGPRKAPVAYIARIAFHDPDDADARALTPLAGLALRYSPRATALFVYLHIRCDFDTGAVRSGPTDWADPTEHDHDPRTVRDALVELLGERPTPGGEHLQVLTRSEGGYAFTEEYWRVRQLARAHRGESGSPWSSVRVSGAILRGGPAVALPDGQRLVYFLLRLLAPAEIRHTKRGESIGARKRSAAFLARIAGLCEATVLEAVRRLRTLGLIRAEPRPFRPTLYSCPFDPVLEVLGRRFHLLYVPDSTVPPEVADATIGRLVAAWFDALEKRRPARLVLA